MDNNGGRASFSLCMCFSYDYETTFVECCIKFAYFLFAFARFIGEHPRRNMKVDRSTRHSNDCTEEAKKNGKRRLQNQSLVIEFNCVHLIDSFRESFTATFHQNVFISRINILLDFFGRTKEITGHGSKSQTFRVRILSTCDKF